jgi:hypothetical protein
VNGQLFACSWDEHDEHEPMFVFVFVLCFCVRTNTTQHEPIGMLCMFVRSRVLLTRMVDFLTVQRNQAQNTLPLVNGRFFTCSA